SIGRQVGRTGRLAATGLSSLADIPNLGALAAHAAGLKETPTFYEPISGRVQNYIDELTKGKLKPRNKAEEWMDTIGEALAPLALSPVTGGASLTALGAKQLAKAGAKGATKKASEKLASMGANTYKFSPSNVLGTAGSASALKTYMDYAEDPNVAGSLAASF